MNKGIKRIKILKVEINSSPFLFLPLPISRKTLYKPLIHLEPIKKRNTSKIVLIILMIIS